MRKIGLYVLLSILLIGGIAFSQNKAQAPQVAVKQPAQEFPADNQEQTIWFNFDGKWMPDVDSSLIGPKNFKDLKNLRYTDAALEGVAGYTKLNSTALVTYTKIRNGFHFKKDQPSESHVLVQAYNAGLTASNIYENITAIPSAGDFYAGLWTDASGAGLGRFSQGPRGTVLYANGKESMIWGGTESQLGAFITSTAAITNSITNPRDFTSKVTNTLQTEDQLALIGGGNDAATVLLLHTDGADASTTFTDSSTTPHTLTAAGDAQIDVAQAVFGSGSGLFDGTGDYVTIPDNADFNLGTGTLTLDLRVRFNTITGMQVLYMQKDATNGDHILLWQDHVEGKLHFQVTDTGASVINEVVAWVPSAATWYHLALIRGWGGVADDWAITVNGTSIHTFTNAGTMPNHDQVVTIGGNLGTTYALDYTARHPAMTWAGTAQISTAQEKWGNASLLLDGNSDYLTIADSADWEVISQANFSIDMWVRHTTHAGSDTYIEHTSDVNNYWWFGHSDDGAATDGIRFIIQSGGGGTELDLYGGEIGDSDWHHVLICKVGADWGIYKDGVQVAYASYATPAYTNNSFLNIGAHTGPTDYLDGHIDDIRITHDNIFTAAPVVGLTDTITVPTVPHSDSTNAKLAIRFDTYDFNGWLDEIRLKKASAAWTAAFTIPARAYSDNALYWVVGSTRPLQGLKTYIANANTETAATVTGTYWNGYSWTSLGTFVDNTSGLETTGTMTWDSTVLTAKPKFLEGYFLYFYQFALSAGSADIYYVTVDAPFQNVVDIWDGVYRQPIAFQASRSAVYEDYTLEVNTESTVADPIAATIGGLTNTDHVIIMFDDRTTAIRWQMIAGKGNTTNATTTIYYWDGSAWVSVGSVVDLTLDSGATDTLNQTGVMSWTPPSIESEFQQELFGVTGYAYKIMFSATLLDGTDHDGTSVGIISGIPAQQKIKPYKFPSTYKNRVMLCGFTESNEGNRVDYSLTNAPDVYNGADSSEGGLQSLYFGGEEELTAATQLYNRFGSNIFATWLVFKNSETYLLTGDTPEDFKISPISFNVGCPAPLTLATAELGYEIANEAQRNVALWLSNTGPMMFDGAVFVPLRGVDKFFDATYTDSINQAYIANSRGWYDPLFREYNLLIPTGAAQVTCDTWLVYDLVRKKWYQKDTGVAAYPQAGFQVSDTTGKKYIYGAIDTGYMMRMEYGYTWNTTPITYVAEVGDFYPTGSQWDITRLRRVKLTSKMISEDVDVTVYHYEDTDDTTETAIATIPLDGVANRITRETPVINSVAWSHRLKFQASTSATSRGFSPTSWGVQYFIQRKDLATDMSFTDTPTLPHVGDSKSIYYVNYAATDQGVDANDQSLFDLCDSVIGTSKKAIVKFKKWRATGDTTDYTVTTNIDLSAYTNITFEFERGAELTGAGNVIFPSPANINAAQDQQIISSAYAGAISFATSGEMWANWFGIDAAALNACVTALPANSKLKLIQGSTYDLNTTTWTINKAIFVQGLNTIITYGGTGTAVLYGAASGVQLVGGRIDGLDIVADVTNWTDTTIGLHLRNCYEGVFSEVRSEGFQSGILVEGLATGCVYNKIYPKHLKNNRWNIRNAETTGGWSRQNTVIGGRWDINTDSTLNGRVDKATVSFESADSSINDSEGALDLTTLFAADDFIVVSGSTYNNDIFKISTVAASKIVISEVSIRGKATPVITEAAGAAITIGQASAHIKLVAGSGWHFINPSLESVGATYACGIITEGGLTFFNGGRTESSTTSGRMYVSGDYNWIEIPLYGTTSRITNAGDYNHIRLWKGQYDEEVQTVLERVFRDATSYIKYRNTNSTGNEIIKAYDASDTYQRMGIKANGELLVFNSTGDEIQRFRAIVKNNYSQFNSSGTGEDNLASQAIAANTMGATGSLRIVATGLKTGVAGNKTIKLHWGTDSWTVHPAANNANDWRMEAEIGNVNATNSQRISYVCYDGTTVVAQGYETSAQDTTGNVTVKLTGECADAGDVIGQRMWLVQMY